MSTKHIAIVCNPKSGKGKPLRMLPAFTKYLKENRITFEAFTGSLPCTLEGFTDLVIMGGDGTLNYTLNHFKEISIPIGVIRSGTGNDFADLLLGKKIAGGQLFEKAVYGIPQRTDAGVCNGRIFINGVGIGFDGWVVRKLLAKSLFTGKAAYYSTVIGLLLFYCESEVKIGIDGETRSVPLFMFSAANGRTYGGGFRLAPRASVTDGLLDLLTVTKISLLKRLRYLPVIEKGKHLDKPLPFLTYENGTGITITSSKKLQAHLDGEWMESGSFEIRMMEGAYLFRC